MRNLRFREEFPNYKYSEELREAAQQSTSSKEDPSLLPVSEPRRTCDDVFDAFLAHCEMRVTTMTWRTPRWSATARFCTELASSTRRPRVEEREVLGTRRDCATAAGGGPKDLYQRISPLRCAFEFGYKDHPDLRQSRRRLGFLAHHEERPNPKLIRFHTGGGDDHCGDSSRLGEAAGQL